MAMGQAKELEGRKDREGHKISEFFFATFASSAVKDSC
jgi:hypothetical protein